MAKAKTNINIRLFPTTTGNSPVGILKMGQEVNVLETIGDWAKIEAYVYAPLLESTIVAPTGSKIGHHINAGNDTNRIIDHFRIMHNKGKPIGGCTVLMPAGVNEWLPAEIKKVSPTTIIVGRIYKPVEPDQIGGKPSDPSTWAKGKDWFNDHLDEMRAISGVDYWQLDNEWGTLSMPEHPEISELPKYLIQAKAFSDFFIDMMIEANKHGIKLCVGNIGVGQIQRYAILELRRMLSFAEKHGHALSYHAYNGGARTPITEGFYRNGEDYWYARRYVQWIDGLPDLKIILTEAGAGDAKYSKNPELEFAFMQELDRLVSNDKNVLFFSWWSLNPHGADWEVSDYKEVLPLLEK